MGYYQENCNALDILRTEKYRTQYHGIDTIIKPVPGKIAGHGLDPVLAAINENDEQMKVFKAIEAKYGGMPPAQVMRENEIDNTIDLTESPIELIEKTVATEDGKARLMVYSRSDRTTLRPIIIFIHGGAFTGGSVKQVNYFCKLLAELHNVIVVNVEYRLAPENPFPAGFNDCWAAVHWTYENAADIGGNVKKIIISGDSAGGNLAASCCQKDRNEGTAYISAQVLLYPAVLVGKAETDDYHWDIGLYDFEEDRTNTENLARALEFSDEFLPFVYMGRPAPITDPYASPLFGSTDELPQAVIMTSEYDYLRPQAEAYVRKLVRSGVHVKYIMYKGCAHATIANLGKLPQAYDMALEFASVIN